MQKIIFARIYKHYNNQYKYYTKEKLKKYEKLTFVSSFLFYFFNCASGAELTIKVLNIQEKVDQFILLYMIIQNSFLKTRKNWI